MDCTALLLLLLVWDLTASGTARSKTEDKQLSAAMLLLAVPEAISSHTRMRSRHQLCSSLSVLLLAVPEAVLSHTKTKRISSTRSQLRQERVRRCFFLLIEDFYMSCFCCQTALVHPQTIKYKLEMVVPLVTNPFVLNSFLCHLNANAKLYIAATFCKKKYSLGQAHLNTKLRMYKQSVKFSAGKDTPQSTNPIRDSQCLITRLSLTWGLCQDPGD